MKFWFFNSKNRILFQSEILSNHRLVPFTGKLKEYGIKENPSDMKLII